MRHFILIVAALIVGSCSAKGAGFQVVYVPDPGNPPIELGIWYPSPTIAKPERLGLDTQTVAQDGQVGGAPQGLKLVMMSHGQGGTFEGHYDTALALADAGFVAAALTHTGDNYRDQSRVLLIQDRSRQLRVVTDYMLRDWPAHALIDPDRIGVFGFSAGGFTALVAAGGVPDTALIGPHCAANPGEYTCGLIARTDAAVFTAKPVPAGAWVHDPRIRAAVVVAPALGFTFGHAGLAGLHVPVQLWRAADDHILPQPFYAQAVADALPRPPDYHIVPGADHFDFLSPCNAAKARLIPIICTSAPGFNRAAFHAAFDAAVVGFFQAHLTAAPAR